MLILNDDEHQYVEKPVSVGVNDAENVMAEALIVDNLNEADDHPVNLNGVEEHPVILNEADDHLVNLNGAEENPVILNEVDDHSVNFNGPEEHLVIFNEADEHPANLNDAEEHPVNFNGDDGNPHEFDFEEVIQRVPRNLVNVTEGHNRNSNNTQCEKFKQFKKAFLMQSVGDIGSREQQPHSLDIEQESSFRP